MKLTKEQINKMRPKNGWVLIQLKMFNDEILFKDGTKLSLETMFNPENHISVDGIVKAVPDKLNFNKKSYNTSDQWLTDIEIKVGERVFFEYFAALMALGLKANKAADHTDDKWIEDEDNNLYIFIKYTDIFFVYNDDGEFRLLNGYVMIELIEAELKAGSGIIIPDQYKKKNVGNYGIVHYTGSCNKDYLENQNGKQRKVDVQDVQAGDVVLYRKHGNQRVEQLLHRKLPLMGGEYYCLQRWRIMLCFRGEIKDAFMQTLG